jgi:hypothetical protein
MSTASAQLPADSVDLSKVKIKEHQKSVDLCPVHLVKSDPKLPAFTYKGVEYRGHTAECQAEFEKDPEKYAKAAQYKRWENNFVQDMSIIWCPVTDEVNPGGGKQWKKLGIVWESCCKFCDEDVTEEDFPEALKRLKERAKEAYKATGGKYVKEAKSPVEGAIKDPDAPEAGDKNDSGEKPTEP